MGSAQGSTRIIDFRRLRDPASDAREKIDGTFGSIQMPRSVDEQSLAGLLKQLLGQQSPAHPARRGYCVAGKVNSTDKLYLVIESVRLDTKYARSSTAPDPVDSVGGLPLP